MKSYLLILTILFFIFCDSQSPKTARESFKIGTLQGNIFSNNYFAFKVIIDSPWHIQNEAELSHLLRKRTEMLKENTDESLSISKGTDILLSLNIDTIENMPQVIFGSLDLRMFPQIKNEKDYLHDYFKQVKKLYGNYDLQITSSAIGQEAIGKQTFFTTLITIKNENFLAYQKRYSIKIKDRLLNLMINYNTEAYLNECIRLLNKIEWK